jgi:hypothetical protein
LEALRVLETKNDFFSSICSTFHNTHNICLFIPASSLVDWVKDGVAKYWNNKEEDCLAMIKLWGPVDCIQFSMPIHISMPFRHLVSFFWTAYVSFTRGGSDDEEDSKKDESTLKRRLSVSGDY